MTVAVFSQDSVTARMLLLEAKRCGLQVAEAQEAHVWLLDLDALPRLPKGASAPMQIGFCQRPDDLPRSTREGLYALLTLPFSARELDAVLHRSAATPTHVLQSKGEEFWLSGKRLRFSKTEQALLSLLYQNKHRVVKIEELSDLIGESAVNSNATAVYLYRLRRKLEADGITRIRTVRGVGYQWMGE